METAQQKAARQAAEKKAAEEKAAQDAAAAQAAKDAEEKAAKDAEEKAAQEAAEKEAAEKAAQEASALAAKSSGVMKVFCKLPSGMAFSMPGGDIALKGATASALVGGHGITFLPKAEWEALHARYGNMTMFAKKIIFAEESLENGLAVAREMNGEKTGFEGIDPKSPGKDLEPATK